MALTDEQKREIDSARAETRPTLRATVPALEEILHQPLPVLDHGFVRVIDYMGTMRRSSRPPACPTGAARARSARTGRSSTT